MGKNKLHPTQVRALEKVWRHGLTDAQMQIVDVLDEWSKQYPESPSIYEIVNLTGLSYGAVWTALGVLEYFGYISLCRDVKGRMYHRGVIVNHGFDLSEDSYE